MKHSLRWILVPVLFVLGCAMEAPMQQGMEKHQLCSGQADVPCLSAKSCVSDEARSCQVCRCTTPYAPMPCWATYGSRTEC